MGPGTGRPIDLPAPPPLPPRPVPALFARTVLDEQLAWSRSADPRPWGAWPWVGPVFVTIAVIVVNQVAVHLAPATGDGRLVLGVVVALASEVVVLASVWWWARRSVARLMPFPASIGLQWITRRDWLPWIAGFAISFAGRLFVGLLAAAVTRGAAVREAQNIHLHHVTVATVVALLVFAVVIAPVVEEITFRGLLLRTFMRRLSFWPAALASTAIFGLFHTYEVRTVAGALTLLSSVAVLGLVNCYLVRITGRLTPGIMGHASANLLATIVAVHLATR